MRERPALVICLIAGMLCLTAAGFSWRLPVGAKLANTASLLLGIASILQLRVSGWFDRVINYYGDEAKFPFGPPSHITRQIIDNPDTPIATGIRNILFFQADTGAYLGLASLIIAIVAVWLPSS